MGQPTSDQLPAFLVKSVRKKTNLILDQFIFKQDAKLNLLKSRKQSLSHLPASSLKKNEPLQPLIHRHQSETKLYEQSLLSSMKQAPQNGPPKYNFEHKLPALVKLNVQLHLHEQEEKKFIRVTKDDLKTRHSKPNAHFRHVSEKNEVVRLKQLQNSTKKQEQHERSSPIALTGQKSLRDRQNQRCYFIRNLVLNSVTALEAENKQRASLNLLVSKLKQTQRRGRQGISLLDKKVEQNAPSELIANKITYEEVERAATKQDVKKRGSTNLMTQRKQKARGLEAWKNGSGEDNLSGWNTRSPNHHLIFESQQF